MTDISAVLTAHREGGMAGIALRSMLEAVDAARAAGLEVELIGMLDGPDHTTADVLSGAAGHGMAVHQVDLRDQGLVRNEAVRLSSGRYVAFLDGDDLWSDNWLVRAHELCSVDAGRVIAHPEVDWFFGLTSGLSFHVDQLSPEFDPQFLRLGNYWDALCLAPREAYEQHPFSERAVQDGFAYEDWHWNIETYEAGFVHRVARDTIHFKRRRPGSQTMQAYGEATVPRPLPFHAY